jgi:tripartite ATP-independent transporter DctP family solute receptor
MSKKILISLLILMVGALSIWAGGKAEPVAPGKEKITLRFAIVSGPAHAHNRAIEAWAKRVLEETNGRLEIRLLGAGQLGGERDYIEGMQLGSIDMAQVSTGPIASFVPSFAVLSLPYVVTSYEQIESLVTGPVGDYLFKELEPTGMKGLTFFTNGFRSVFTRNVPVRRPADLAGQKIRVMESPLMVSTLNAMGASATPMAYGELYTAIQQGVMDGAENAPGNVLNDKFYEVTKFFSDTRHFAPPGVVAISVKAFNSLPTDLQQYLVKSTLELGRMARALDKEEQEKALAALEAAGMTVIRNPNIDEFRASVRPVVERFGAQLDPKLMKLLAEAIGM